jgi:hypothetical protein
MTNDLYPDRFNRDEFGLIDGEQPIDWTNRLNDGLVFAPAIGQAPPGWTGSPTTVFDMVRGGKTPNDGVIHGGVTWQPGPFGSCLAFDGSTEYVSIPDSPSLRPAQISLALWTCSFSYSTLTVLCGKQRSGSLFPTSASYGLVFRTGPARMTFTICDGSDNEYYAASTGQVTGVWQHWVGTYDGTTQKLYLDGVLQDMQSQGIAIAQTASKPFLVGGYTPIGMLTIPNFPFNGSLDGLRIFSRALSPAEIAQDYADPFRWCRRGRRVLRGAAASGLLLRRRRAMA